MTDNPAQFGRSFWLAIRPKTLPASLSPVILGTSFVPAEQLNWLLVFCALGCALFLQITVNLANDFFDAKNGVDTNARLGPIRVTQAGLASPSMVAAGIGFFVVLSIICGLILVAHSDLLLLGVGGLCILAALGYSGGPAPLASMGLGEIAVLIFFGWIAVLGSFYVHTQTLDLQLFLLSNSLGLILAAVMLVNNIRDIPTDAQAGKRTLAVRLNDRNSRFLYLGLLTLAYILHICAFTTLNTKTNLISALIPLAVLSPFALKAANNILRFRGKELNSLLADTALLGLIYSLTTSGAYLIGPYL